MISVTAGRTFIRHNRFYLKRGVREWLKLTLSSATRVPSDPPKDFPDMEARTQAMPKVVDEGDIEVLIRYAIYRRLHHFANERGKTMQELLGEILRSFLLREGFASD